MNILLTNDDGILAPGIAAMYNKLTELGDVTVVAPESERSGASHSITLKPISCEKLDLMGKFSGYSVDGSPADCVKLAIRELIAEPIDLVVSGINLGANVGINICYSGTVAAALEASFFDVPAIAVSAAYEENVDFDAIANYGIEIIKNLLPVQPSSVTNINIPRLSSGKPKGVKVVPQSTVGFKEFYEIQQKKEGKTSYQINGGPHKDKQDAATDSNYIAQGYITVTALSCDLTDHSRNANLEQKEFNVFGEKNG